VNRNVVVLHRFSWVLQLIWSSIAGSVIRLGRRVSGKRPRIWHGTFPMHMIKDMVDVDRLAGFTSFSIVHHTRLNPSYSLVNADDFDVVVAQDGHTWDVLHWATLCTFLRRADIFVMFFDTRFSAITRPEKTKLALSIMRWCGIRLIALPSGLDVVFLDQRTSRYGFLERLQKDYQQWDLESDRVHTRKMIQTICNNVDLVVSGDSVCSRFLMREDLRFKYFPVNISVDNTSEKNEQGRPLIVHAPNHRNIKGTASLVTATQRLRDAGFEFELRLVEKIPPPEAIEIYAQADIIADQFCIGAFGVFALEGLALGKPVLTYLDEEHLGDPIFNLPIVNTNPENLERVLAALIDVPELRTRLGYAGQSAVERYQSPNALAEVWSRIYRHLWWGEPLELEVTRHFSPERKPRSFTEDPALEKFWPVDIEDLLPRIQAAMRRVECTT